MNKRRIALLAGLMTMGVLSFAADVAEDNNTEVLTPIPKGVTLVKQGEGSSASALTPKQQNLNFFNINDRIRYDQNRMEINGNFHLNENNRLEMRVRSYTGIGYGDSSSRKTDKETSDRTEVRLRLHTATSIENMEVRTELKTNTYENSGNTQLFRVQPTWHLFTGVEGLTSLARAGVAMEHSGDAHGEDYMITTSFENSYVINDYLEIQGNIYYDYTFAGDGANDGQYHNVEIEAYVFTNYPLYESNDIKVDALFEGGLDPYGFGARHFDDLNDAMKNNGDDEYYVMYLEPSVKVTKRLNDSNNIYFQGGYYTERNEDSTSSFDDTPFVRFGFTSKF